MKNAFFRSFLLSLSFLLVFSSNAFAGDKYKNPRSGPHMKCQMNAPAGKKASVQRTHIRKKMVQPKKHAAKPQKVQNAKPQKQKDIKQKVAKAPKEKRAKTSKINTENTQRAQKVHTAKANDSKQSNVQQKQYRTSKQQYRPKQTNKSKMPAHSKSRAKVTSY